MQSSANHTHHHSPTLPTVSPSQQKNLKTLNDAGPISIVERLKSNMRYRIEGGHKLEGTVTVGGAKNAIGKQLVASLLTDEPCVFENVPRIAEISAILGMLEDVGTQYEWLDDSTLQVQTPGQLKPEISQKYSGFNRIPILMLSPLLHRAGEATVPHVGGCPIGPRPVDFHIKALENMGASIEVSDDRFTAKAKQLQGTTITLPYPSVGATENAILAATLASGTTVINNAAIEPEVIDTILFLQKMGALITVEVDRRIIIEGVTKLRGATHRVITDRIEVASFAAAAVATNGRVTVRNAQQDHMIAFLNSLRKSGGGFTVEKEGITFFRQQEELQGIHVETDVHPGFMTDWQQPFVVLLTQAHGVSVVHETVYENRFAYTQVLSQMGADIELSTSCLGRKSCRFLNQKHLHSCVVKGPTPIRGMEMTIPDLRAGFAYIIAALVAEGVSEIGGIGYVERGYARMPEKLQEIGAAFQME